MAKVVTFPASRRIAACGGAVTAGFKIRRGDDGSASGESNVVDLWAYKTARRRRRADRADDSGPSDFNLNLCLD